MTTEGDGNYGLQRFLEAEGAEPDIQIVTAWLLYMIWQGRYDTDAARDAPRRRQGARSEHGGSKFSLEGRRRPQAHGVAVGRREGAPRSVPDVRARRWACNDYHLPDMNQIAEISHAFYDNNLRGGEGHMEVGKLIQNVAYSKVNMTLSVKPFGCMPSSSVSDGIQSFITELYPQGIFLPIETNGDGAVNVYSRVQMQLFKAKQLAQKEVDKALADVGMTMDEVRAYLKKHPAMTQRVPPRAAQGRLHGGGPRLRGRRAQEPPALPQGARRRDAHGQGRRRSTRRRTSSSSRSRATRPRKTSKKNSRRHGRARGRSRGPGGAADSGRPQEPPRRQLRREARSRPPAV